MILDVNGVAFSYGGNIVLKNITFRINEGDRMAVVGHNGCGKTTLLNLITGELEPSDGTIAFRRGESLGYLRQMAGLNPEKTLYDEMKSAGGADRLLARMKELEHGMADDPALAEEYQEVSARYEALDGYHLDYNIKRILTGMAFGPETYDRPVAVLSGGEKTRLALAKLLMMSPDLLVLDEPTNHLDIDMLEWLEQFLLDYRGAVLAVSHDRTFLDHIATRVMEIQNGKSSVTTGNYTAFLTQKEHHETRERETRRRTAEEAQKLKEYAERNIARASTSNMAKSRLKMLGRLDLPEAEHTAHTSIRFGIEPQSEPYKDVLTAQQLNVAAGGRPLVQNLNFILRRGDHLAIIGPNGAGKTTLIRTLLGRIPPAGGWLRLSGGVRAGILEQQLFGIPDKNPFEYVRNRYPAMTQQEIRSLLAAVGFRGEDAFLPSAGLSGGELARLNLARLALERPNLLVLDEPTNHLDIYTRDIMYAALKNYAGTMIVVTHDRFLMEELNCRILLLKDGAGVFYENFAQWRLGLDMAGQPDPPRMDSPAPLPEKISGQKERRQERARERERLQYLESRIGELEGDITYLAEELERPEHISDHEKLSDLCAMLEAAKSELSALEDEWLRETAD